MLSPDLPVIAAAAGASTAATPLKQLFSAAGIVLTFVALVPYIRAIRRGTMKPHVFSWVIWGIATFVVFLAQLAAHGGIGAWPVGVSGLVTLYIAVLAYLRRADTHITKLDWIFLIASLAALPAWFFTADPLWAVVILTTVDLLGYGPTIRRAYAFPHEESIVMFAHFAVRNLLVVLALEHYSLATMLFPVAVGIACVILCLLLAVRRRALPKPSAGP